MRRVQISDDFSRDSWKHCMLVVPSVLSIFIIYLLFFLHVEINFVAHLEPRLSPKNHNLLNSIYLQQLPY